MNWCASCGRGRNFGDRLGPLLYRHFGHVVEWAPPHEAEIVTVGSILSKVPNGWTGKVVGTGFIRPGMSKDLRRADVRAVRGHLTRKAARLGRVPVGDLGVLVCDLPRDSVPPIDILAVPHYVDHELGGLHDNVADICWDAPRLLGPIAAAGCVITSSLHALIAADALGVPHILAPHPDVVGGIFKFDDYASAFDTTIRPGYERLTPRPEMEAKQAELRALL
jgi:hypothetical protein